MKKDEYLTRDEFNELEVRLTILENPNPYKYGDRVVVKFSGYIGFLGKKEQTFRGKVIKASHDDEGYPCIDVDVDGSGLESFTIQKRCYEITKEKKKKK